MWRLRSKRFWGVFLLSLWLGLDGLLALVQLTLIFGFFAFAVYSAFIDDAAFMTEERRRSAIT